MCIVWLTLGLNYYLLFFLTNKFSDVYLVAIVASISELLGYGFSGFFFNKLGTKWTMVGSFGMSFIAGILMALTVSSEDETWYFLIFILFAKFGISSAYNVVYLANSSLFPILFASTALGYCSFLSRIFSAVSPFLVDLEEPWPIVIFTVMALISGVMSIWLKELDSDSAAAKKATTETSNTLTPDLPPASVSI